MSRVSVYLVGIIATLGGLGPRPAEAQMITRWVDANGVVTFTTSSPPPGVAYETIRMPTWSRRSAAGKLPTGSRDATETPEEATAAGKTAKAAGPAQLKVLEPTTTPLGDARFVISGKVTNEGGAPADGIGVHINVLEDGQGNPCFDGRGTVSPGTLQPGETGTFELTYDSPCFFGSPQIDIVAEWR